MLNIVILITIKSLLILANSQLELYPVDLDNTPYFKVFSHTVDHITNYTRVKELIYINHPKLFFDDDMKDKMKITTRKEDIEYKNHYNNYLKLLSEESRNSLISIINFYYDINSKSYVFNLNMKLVTAYKFKYNKSTVNHRYMLYHITFTAFSSSDQVVLILNLDKNKERHLKEAAKLDAILDNLYKKSNF